MNATNLREEDILMKKLNFKFILIEGVILLAISLIGGFIISICMGPLYVFKTAMIFAMLLFFGLCMFMCVFGNMITGAIAKKTLEKNCAEQNFGESSTFVTSGSFTIGGILRIDETNGRVAFVSYQNPYEFQLANAKNLEKINSSYIKGPLGGTSYVYFEFYYNGKRTRIPTFTSSNTYSIQSSEVMEGISKADAFCDILKNAQNA